MLGYNCNFISGSQSTTTSAETTTTESGSTAPVASVTTSGAPLETPDASTMETAASTLGKLCACTHVDTRAQMNTVYLEFFAACIFHG